MGANLVSHLIEMGLLLVALLAFGNWRALVYLPFVVLLTVLMALFALGLGLMLSVFNVYFRDIQHFMGILFLVWLYMTPIIYSLVCRAGPLQGPAQAQPHDRRRPVLPGGLYDGTHPGWLQFGYFAAWAIGTSWSA